MGRSRVVSHTADDDINQRSKRKRTASTVENLEPTSTGQGMSEGKGALYHCNYCNKDISGKVRIKCAMCPDFDLCIECFSVGAEVTPHKSNHSYRVMDNLSFPFICPDWNADEEILLLEGIEMYGLGNWMEVAEHVGTKSKSQCIDHYNTIYMNSPCFPLPDMSHVMGKSREELLAMAKGHGEVKKGFQALEELSLKEESPFSAGVKIEESRKEGPAGQSSSSLTSGSSTNDLETYLIYIRLFLYQFYGYEYEIQIMHALKHFPIPSTPSGVGSSMGSSSNTSMAAVKKASNAAQIKNVCDNVKVEESQADRSFGEKKPRMSGDEGPSMTEFSGFNFKRQEFENEYDNDAEQLLSDMEFKNTDTDAERELKLRVLRIYNKRLEERKRRKDFILERNLLYPDPFEKTLSPEEREECQKYKVFMRFHSKEEHEELLKTVIEEHRILKRIQDLQEARAAGCRTSAEAERHVEQKRKKEAEEMARRVKESSQASPGGKFLLRPHHPKGEIDGSPREGIRGPTVLESGGKDLSSMTAGQDLARSVDVWDITGLPGADLLSEAEKQLCGEMKILPSHYLNMLQTMSMGIINGNITQKSDAHNLFKVESSKVDRIYDMLVKKKIAPQC